MLLGVDKIDPNHPKCNPFSYLTQICYNVFRQKIKSEKKYNLTKQKYRLEKYDEFEQDEQLTKTQDNNDE